MARSPRALRATIAVRRAASLRPTAIRVGRHGTSYVGFVSGGAIARLDADGHRRATVRLPRGATRPRAWPTPGAVSAPVDIP